MNKIKIILIKILIALLLCLNGIDAWASKPSERKWSFEFENISVKEALIKISDAAGVTFAADEQVLEKRLARRQLNKSYHGQYLDKIIQDVFRKNNCAFTWYYKNNQLNYVEIWLIENEDKKNPDRRMTGGPGAFKAASPSNLPSAASPSPANQGFRKTQRRFGNSGKHSLSGSRRTTKGQKDGHVSSTAAEDNSDTVSQVIIGQETDLTETSDESFVSLNGDPFANEENTTNRLQSGISSEIAETTESTSITNSADVSSVALKTDTLALISQTENSINTAKSGLTDANPTEDDREMSVPKADNENDSSNEDNSDSPAVVSKAWLVEQMRTASEVDEPDAESVYKADAEMP